MLHVAFLRAINVGGRNRLSMTDLRKLCDDLGFAKPRTLLQSGNLVFESDLRSDAKLEELLETETAARLNLTLTYVVRSPEELSSIVKANPFKPEAKDNPGHLLVNFLKETPGAAAVKSLNAAIKGSETAQVLGKDAYIYFPDGVGRSKLTTAVIEAKLGTRGTARNWNTLLKLVEMTES